jgi:hypothetical protein
MDMEQMYGLLGMNQSRNVAPSVTPSVAQPVARPAAQPVSAEMSNLDRLNQLMSGSRSDFIRGLGTWEKVGLAGRALQNFGRPDAADPVQALRQEQLQGLQGRLQVEQLRAAALQRQQQAAAAQQFAVTLPEAQRTAFLALAPEQQVARMETEAFKQRQVFQRDRDPATGNVRLTYGNGDVEVTDQPMPANGEWQAQEINGRQEQVWMDKDTGRPLLDASGQMITRFEGMNASQRATLNVSEANLALARQKFARGDGSPSSGGGGGGGRRNAPAEITDASGNRVVAQWDPQSQQYYLAGTNQVVNRGVSASGNPLLDGVLGAGGRQFGR